jgi:hypothetical protein
MNDVTRWHAGQMLATELTNPSPGGPLPTDEQIALALKGALWLHAETPVGSKSPDNPIKSEAGIHGDGLANHYDLAFTPVSVTAPGAPVATCWWCPLIHWVPPEEMWDARVDLPYELRRWEAARGEASLVLPGVGGSWGAVDRFGGIQPFGERMGTRLATSLWGPSVWAPVAEPFAGMGAGVHAPMAIALSPDGSQIADVAVSPGSALLGAGDLLRPGMTSGVVARLAGNGGAWPPADGVPATDTPMAWASSVALGPDGSTYYLDASLVRQIDPSGVVRTIAGNVDPTGCQTGDGLPGALTCFDGPTDLAVGSDGAVYVSEYSGRVRRVDPGVDHVVSTVAGNGQYASSGDGGPATAASILAPTAVAVGPDGALYILEGGQYGRVRRVGADGVIQTVAGNDLVDGDGVPATSVLLIGPQDIAVAQDGSFFVAEGGAGRVRKVTPDGLCHTFAGSGAPSTAGGSTGGSTGGGTAGFASSGDGGPALQAGLGYPHGLATAADGSVFIVDWGVPAVRRVDPAGIITTVAPASGTTGLLAPFSWPSAVAVAANGSLVVGDGAHLTGVSWDPAAPLPPQPQNFDALPCLPALGCTLPPPDVSLGNAPRATGFVPVYTKVRRGVFVVGGTNPDTNLATGEIWYLSFVGNRWGRFGRNLAVGHVLGATYAFASDALYVLDETADGSARLSAVDFMSQGVREVGRWPRHAEWDAQWLLVDRDGALLVGSSSTSRGEHAVVRVSTGAAPAAQGIERAPGTLVVAPLVDGAGRTLVLRGATGGVAVDRKGGFAWAPATFDDLAGVL